MILHTVGYPAVKLCNFVCVWMRGLREEPRPGARKVSKLARKFCFLLLINVFTLCTYLPKVQEGGVLFLCFALYVIG